MSEQQLGVPFAEAVGLPANQQAKALARKEAEEKKLAEPQMSFYTVKAPNKVVKQIVKMKGVYEVYIGNLKRHKDGLEPMILKWKEEKMWVEPHLVPEMIKAIRLDLAKKPKAKR